MGEYLSKPIVEKTSSNEHFAHLSYGASTMQGWRSSQEDAHNCIPEFDENTALFAVYDGHGGSSVAKYCSTHLPNYISTLESYKSGNIAQALEDGFLGFDATLTNENVIEILRNLSRDATDVDDNSIPDEDELQELRREAEIPTETLKEYYQYKRPTSEDTEENPQSSSSEAKQSITSEKNSSIKNDEESTDDKCKLANGESGDAESNVKDGVTKIVKEGDVDKPIGGLDGSKSSTCTDKGKKLVKGGKRVTDAGDAKPECSSLDKPGPSQHPEPKTQRKLPVVTQVGSDSEDSDMEDETYEGDALDESESDNDDDEDEDDDDDDDESSEEDDEEKDGEEDDDSMELAKLQELDLTFNSGSTAVVAILRGCELYVANAGDSRCVVSRKGKAIEMSVDHKPEDELEKKRITNAGGKIFAGRINGDLNLSRALGDHRFKQNKEVEPRDQMISALPDIRTLTIDPEEDEFLILACDGIWNYMNSQEVVDFVRKRLKDDMEEISTICEQLFDHCLAPDTTGDGTGCDNMTAIIVKFHQTLGQHVSAKSTHKSPKGKEHEKPEVQEETECKKAKLDSGSQQTSEADS